MKGDIEKGLLKLFLLSYIIEDDFTKTINEAIEKRSGFVQRYLYAKAILKPKISGRRRKNVVNEILRQKWGYKRK